MAILHFLNVIEGDCNIIQHDSGRTTVMDVSNAYNESDTEEEIKARSSQTREMRRLRTQVPLNKTDYRQKLTPDNPIPYLKNILGDNHIFRFIISHPDMDHLDGIRDLYSEFRILNTWDSANNKSIKNSDSFFAGFNKHDWEFYCQLRAGKVGNTRRLTYYDNNNCDFWNQDDIKVLCPSKDLLKLANEKEDYHSSSYVLLFTPPKLGGGRWKFILAGDSHDNSWDYILKNYEQEVTNIDVLFAPHHGRHSNRNFDFVKILNPTVTLFGNASSDFLAYDNYPGPENGSLRMTNNQAGYIIMETLNDRVNFYVKNYEFAYNFCNKKDYSMEYNSTLQAYLIFYITA